MKKHISIKDASEKLGISIETLIHMGAVDELPIYVLPKSEWKFTVTAAAQIPAGVTLDKAQEIEIKQDLKELPINEKLDFDIVTGAGELTGQILCCYFLKVPYFSLREYEGYRETAKLTLLSFNKENFLSFFSHSGEVPIYLKDCYLVIDELDIKKLQGSQFKSSGVNETTAISQDSLLKIIAGMAIRGYKYDPQKSKNSATTDIQVDLDALGISLSEDTIRKALKAAMKLVPQNP